MKSLIICATTILLTIITEVALAQKHSVVANFNDGSGAYVSKRYRNLFQENGYTREKILAKTDLAFQQLFHGDTSKTIYFEAGKNTTRSEERRVGKECRSRWS